MARKIYMAEDEESLNLLLKKYLENEGYEVLSFMNGTSAAVRINDFPDMWILDIMLPDISGYELIRRIKEANPHTPVIFMSARNDELDRVTGLEYGSDDYLAKPFLPRELIIRVNNLFNRIYGTQASENNIFTYSSYLINIRQRTVSENGIQIPLTNHEFELLLYFYRNKNTALTREQILAKLWGVDYFGSDRVVDDTIRRLRRKLKKLEVETVYGYGYKLVVK